MIQQTSRVVSDWHALALPLITDSPEITQETPILTTRGGLMKFSRAMSPQKGRYNNLMGSTIEWVISSDARSRRDTGILGPADTRNSPGRESDLLRSSELLDENTEVDAVGNSSRETKGREGTRHSRRDAESRQSWTQVAAATTTGATTTVPGEVIPWGTSAVWQGENITQRGNFASDTYAFVIDSGVLDTTGDISFASDPSWHRSWITGQSPFTDVNGHGTHVAGTIGALVNGKGIVGVAPGAKIVSLKVNDDSGFGSGSTTIAAINHAVSIINGNNLDKSKVVINLSINGTYDPALNAAIINAANQGIRFAIAAGNSGKDVDTVSPGSAGSHPNVYTVSAIDSGYMMTFWSNWDRLDATDTVDNVDFAAPGSGILSYYKNGQLATLSGTSMASAHVAGLLITGGVQAGHTVIPNYGGTADPFALSSTKVFDPSVNKPIPPAPAPAPAPVAPPTPAPVPVPKPPAPVVTNQYYWGTSGNDIITGSDIPNQVDWLSGVLSTGTTLDALGRGQIDTLIGNVGKDVFMLADKRPIFYDDGLPFNPGTTDYAIIKNFTPGEDKVQIRGVNWVYDYSGGNTSIYFDRNRNGILDITTTSSSDELIAVLEGVTLGSSDIIFPV